MELLHFQKKERVLVYDGTLEFANGDVTINTFNEKDTGKLLLTNSKGKRTKKFLFRYHPPLSLYLIKVF